VKYRKGTPPGRVTSIEYIFSIEHPHQAHCRLLPSFHELHEQTMYNIFDWLIDSWFNFVWEKTHKLRWRLFFRVLIELVNWYKYCYAALSELLDFHFNNILFCTSEVGVHQVYLSLAVINIIINLATSKYFLWSPLTHTQLYLSISGWLEAWSLIITPKVNEFHSHSWSCDDSLLVVSKLNNQFLWWKEQGLRKEMKEYTNTYTLHTLH
jgi:hypothetical protein